MSLLKRTSQPARRNGSAETPSGPRTVAVLHETPSGVSGAPAVSAAVGPVSADGSEPKASSRAVTFRRFAPDQSGALRGFLRDAGVDLVIRIVPATEAICRLSPLPEGASGQDRSAVAEALSLMAETDLPAQLPWYRRTAGLVNIAGAACGLLIGWHKPQGGAPKDPLAEVLQGLPQLFTGEAVGLATILASMREPGAPTEGNAIEWILSANPNGGGGGSAAGASAGGAATLLAIGPTGFRIRGLRANSSSPEIWRAALSEAIQETLDGIGGEAADPLTLPRAAALSGQRAGLVISSSAHPVVAGERRERDWLDDFGIAAATLDVFADPSPAVRGLFNLHAIEPRERANPIIRLVNFLATPARAAVIAFVCAAAILGTRLGVAYARHQAVSKQVANSADLSDRLSEAERQLAFASTLKEKRWPMTKLIADIAAATPVGIELESLELTHGDPAIVRGTAQKNELISQFRENLAKTKVFDNIATPVTSSGQGTVQFTLQATPTRAGVLYQAPPIDDFVKEPLGKRMHGPDWVPDKSATALKGMAAGSHGRTNGRSSDRDRGAASSDSTKSNATRSTTTTVAGEKAEEANKTPPLSDADIAKMNKTEAMLKWTSLKKKAGEATDKAVKERLLAESVKCKARMDELKAAEGGGK